MLSFLDKYLVNPEILGFRDLLTIFVVDLVISALFAFLLSSAIYMFIFRNSVVNTELHSRWGAIRAVHLSWLFGYLITGCASSALVFYIANTGITGVGIWQRVMQILPHLIITLIWLVSVGDQFSMLTRFHQKRI